jgi:hypothetical protein
VDSPGRRLVFKLGLLIASTFVCLVALEIGLRLFGKALTVSAQDAANLGYRYDPELGWFPVANSQTKVRASRPITAKHNSEDFRGPERIASNKPVIVGLRQCAEDDNGILSIDSRRLFHLHLQDRRGIF